ncbi:MAG: hypothetical protein SNJ70_00655 [Armatimonadota bacterium]
MSYIEDLYNSGLNEFNNNNFQTAAEKFRKVLQIDTTHKKARKYLGISLVNSGNPQAAIKYFIELIRLEPSKASNYYNLAKVYQCDGNLQQSIELLQKAIEIDSTYDKAKSDLIELKIEQEKFTFDMHNDNEDLFDSQTHSFKRCSTNTTKHYEQCPHLKCPYQLQNESLVTDAIIILLLIIIWPVGLYFMWHKSNWSEFTKKFITVVVILIIWFISLYYTAKIHYIINF